MDKLGVDWVYLSPHLDDAALSCGGLIWEQVRAGQKVAIWTICAGDIPPHPLSSFAEELHARWKTGPDAVYLRREEDRKACARLGAAWKYEDIPDCIYRFLLGPEGEVPLIRGEADLQGAEPERDLISRLAGSIQGSLSTEARVVCPLAFGGHVDHRLTRAAAELSGLPIFYYPDYPYVLRCSGDLERLANAGWRRDPAQISVQGLTAWQDAIAAHASQISTFWASLADMRSAIHAYWEGGGGRLWERV